MESKRLFMQYATRCGPTVVKRKRTRAHEGGKEEAANFYFPHFRQNGEKKCGHHRHAHEQMQVGKVEMSGLMVKDLRAYIEMSDVAHTYFLSLGAYTWCSSHCWWARPHCRDCCTLAAMLMRDGACWLLWVGHSLRLVKNGPMAIDAPNREKRYALSDLRAAGLPS